MRNTIRNFVACTGVSLVAMLVVTLSAGSNAAARASGDSITAAVIECQSRAAEHDDAAASCGKCGDHFCNPRCGETATSCPADCAGVPSGAEATAEPTERMCGKCGDRFCARQCGETATSCPQDCGAVS